MRLKSYDHSPRTATGLLAKLEALIERAERGLVTGRCSTVHLPGPGRPESYGRDRSSQEVRIAGRKAAIKCYAKHREFIALRRKYQRRFNPEMDARHQKTYCAKNRDNAAWRIRRNLGVRLANSVRNNARNSSILTLLGCSIPNLKIYLESKFQTGMSWDNYGKAWEIDHIMPCAIFDLTRLEHRKRCFHFSNLQPLFGIDNRRKSDKADEAMKGEVRAIIF